ncbi:MAG TPA: hypothetical protein PKI35_07970 [Bacteroidales bacterium]|nr:hypothetical protein [Bacteroidales bacterium]
MKLNKDEMKKVLGGTPGGGGSTCKITCKNNDTNQIYGTLEVSKCNDNDLTKCINAYPDTTVAVCGCSGDPQS